MYHLKYLSFILLFPYFSLGAINLDSLQQAYWTSNKAAEKLDLLLELVDQHNNWDSVILWADEAQVLAEQLQQKLGQAKAAVQKLNAYSFLGESNKIIEHGPSTLKLVEATNDTLLFIKAANLIGSYGYLPQGQFSEAIEMLQKALKRSGEQEKYMRAFAIVSGNLGDCYQHLGDEESKIKVFEKLIELSQRFNNTNALAQTQIQLGAHNHTKEDYEKAWFYYNEAEKGYQKTGDETLLFDILDYKGQLYYKLEQYDSALVYIDSLYNIYEEKEMDYDKNYLKLLIGKIHLATKNHERAEQYLTEAYAFHRALNNNIKAIDVAKYLVEVYKYQDKTNKAILLAKNAIQMAEENKYYEGISHLNFHMANLYEYNGDFAKALTHFKEYKAFTDSTNTQEQIKLKEQLEARFRLKEKDLENEQLLANSERDQAIIRNRGYLNIASLLLLFFSIIIGLLVYRNYQQKTRYSKNLEQEVAAQTKELKKSNSELQRSNDELERFAYITSHDLKEPLRNIISYSGLLQRQKEGLNKDGRTYLEFIRAGTQQMYTLIEDVLEFSMLRKMDIELKQVDLQQVLASVIKQLRPSIEQKNATITHDQLPQIMGNATQMNMLFKNLIENSLKYNEAPQAKIDIRYKETASTHTFEIEDNGIGIAAEFHEQIFKLFKRLHTRSSYQGSGIGLAICERVVQSHGGTIQVKSREGAGSTFIFTIKK